MDMLLTGASRIEFPPIRFIQKTKTKMMLIGGQLHRMDQSGSLLT